MCTPPFKTHFMKDINVRTKIYQSFLDMYTFAIANDVTYDEVQNLLNAAKKFHSDFLLDS